MPGERSILLDVAGREVAVSNPDKVFFPEAGITKLYANGTMKRILAKWGISQFALKR